MAAADRLTAAMRQIDRYRKRRPLHETRVQAEAQNWLARLHATRGSASHGLDADGYEAYLRMQLVKSLRASSRFSFEKKAKVFLQKHVLSKHAAKARVGVTAGVAAAHVAAAPGEAIVLALGCRDALELILLRQIFKTTHVTGLDIFSLDPDITIGDMHAMPFADGSFDAVVACHSLEHAFAPERAIQECVRVLKSGGVLAIEVPVRDMSGTGPLPNAADTADRWDFCNARSLLGSVAASTTRGLTVFYSRDVPEPASRAKAQLVVQLTGRARAAPS